MQKDHTKIEDSHLIWKCTYWQRNGVCHMSVGTSFLLFYTHINYDFTETSMISKISEPFFNFIALYFNEIETGAYLP